MERGKSGQKENKSECDESLVVPGFKPPPDHPQARSHNNMEKTKTNF